MRKRPGLAAEIPRRAHPNTGFLMNLALQTLFQGLAGFDESGERTVHPRREPRRAREEQLPFAPHQPHHRRREPWIGHPPATRALSGALARARLGRLAARPAVLMRAVPVDDLQRPPGQGELRVIERSEQRPQALPSPPWWCRGFRRRLGGEALLPAEHPKILCSLEHHTQILGVI